MVIESDENYVRHISETLLSEDIFEYAKAKKPGDALFPEPYYTWNKKARKLEATSMATVKFMEWMEKWYSVKGKVKRNYGIEEDNELAKIYWEMKGE